MDNLDERLKLAKARNELAAFDDDTAIEEDLAALYLCMSPKTLGEMRPSPGGPNFIKPVAPKAKGRNQPVSYKMGELRKWRESMTAASNLEVARRQGLVGWVSGIEPFWTDKSGVVLGSALDQSAEGWPDLFLKAAAGAVKVSWMAPRRALGLIWEKLSSHASLACEYTALLDDERNGVRAALEVTELSCAVEMRKPASSGDDDMVVKTVE